MKYTLDQLRHLRKIRSIGYDNKFYDDRYNSDRGFFDNETESFLNWIDKMEKNGKIEKLLNTENNT